MRVAIVGGPGVGKSTLVRQLADLYHNGSYGEGEKGVWHPRVLEDIAAGRNPIGVTEYFARLYDANYRDAAAHDAAGRVIFFEGARMTLEAHIPEYPAAYHDALRRVAALGEAGSPIGSSCSPRAAPPSNARSSCATARTRTSRTWCAASS